MATMKSIAISDIAPNPYRNFDIYPVDNKQVEALADSYSQADDFGVLPVRRSYYADEGYEQAAGHHRLEAMKSLGYERVQVLIGDYDDDDMVKIMALENARQKGDNAPAQLDALAGIVQRVAYLMLIADDSGSTAENSALLNSTDKVVKQAKSKMLSGHGVSSGVIEAYSPGLWGGQMLRQLLTTLKDSGELATIVGRVQQEVQDAHDAEAAEEEERREKAAKLAADRARAEAKAIAAAKKAVEASKKARAAEKKEAEAHAILVKKQAATLAKLREKAAKEEAIKREKAEKAAQARRKQLIEAAASKAAFAEKARGLNPEVLHLIPKDDHLETFRKVVTSVEGQRVFPASGQPELVREMIEWCTVNTPQGRMTARGMTEFLHGKLVEKNATMKELIRQQEANAEKVSFRKKVDRVVDTFGLHIGNVNTALLNMAEMLEDEKMQEYAYYRIATNQKLGQRLDQLELMVSRVRQNMTVRESYARTNTVTEGGEIVSVQ